MRILGLDYGTKTVGVAVTDALGITVQPLETITRDADNKLRPTLRRIEELIEEMNVQEIVLGLPLNMDGSEGERATRSREFADMLERRTGLSVHLLDERLTTLEADEILDSCGIPKKNHKRYVDSVAAVLILEDYVRNCC
ncbi:MAG: Holliday junction resolvase RuvX [Bacteroides sp.]|nr:Holliday junction resolvase RuvX [Clostridia bacterium]